MHLLLGEEDNYCIVLQAGVCGMSSDWALLWAKILPEWPTVTALVCVCNLPGNFGLVTVVTINTHFLVYHTLLLILQKDCYQLSMFFWGSWHILYSVNHSRANLSKPNILTITKNMFQYNIHTTNARATMADPVQTHSCAGQWQLFPHFLTSWYCYAGLRTTTSTCWLKCSALLDTEHLYL